MGTRPLCFCGCGQPADAHSLWRGACKAARDAERAAKHAGLHAERTALLEAEERERKARPLVDCERCGEPNSAVATWVQAEQVEAERQRIQAELAAGRVRVDGQALTGKEGYLRSIELTAPHRLQQARPWCQGCQAALHEDWKEFLSSE
jgi:hypothetical protein